MAAILPSRMEVSYCTSGFGAIIRRDLGTLSLLRNNLLTWRSIWTLPHSVSTGVKKRPDSPFEIPCSFYWLFLIRYEDKFKAPTVQQWLTDSTLCSFVHFMNGWDRPKVYIFQNLFICTLESQHLRAICFVGILHQVLSFVSNNLFQLSRNS